MDDEWPYVRVYAPLRFARQRVVEDSRLCGLPAPDRCARSATGHVPAMDSHEPDFIVVGDRVALGPLRRDLAADYARWMNVSAGT